jgi:hypothetical protein
MIAVVVKSIVPKVGRSKDSGFKPAAAQRLKGRSRGNGREGSRYLNSPTNRTHWPTEQVKHYLRITRLNYVCMLD